MQRKQAQCDDMGIGIYCKHDNYLKEILNFEDKQKKREKHKKKRFDIKSYLPNNTG